MGHISADQSDDLCRIATGFGYSTRTLFSTDEETTFEFARPQIVTAIDSLVTRDDLADRVLMVQLGEISEQQRLPQAEFMSVFNDSRELSRQVVIESSPVGEAIIRLMENRKAWEPWEPWQGTASELLNELENHTDEATYRSRYFPKTALKLGI